MPTDFLMIGMVAETHIHVGEGQQYAAVDLPVARERASGYPFIPGSSLKGAMRMAYRQRELASSQEIEVSTNTIFGSDGGDGRSDEGGAGAIIVSDARLIALPVRSTFGPFKYVSCPSLISRLDRDISRCGASNKKGPLKELLERRPNHGEILLAEVGDRATLCLEELQFVPAPIDDGNLSELSKLWESLFGKPIADDLKVNFAIVSDLAFAWLAKNGLPVRARNRLSEMKTVVDGALWYEETLPPNTLMTALIGARMSCETNISNSRVRPNTQFLKTIKQSDKCYLQVGGNETVGQGWFQLLQLTQERS